MNERVFIIDKQPGPTSFDVVRKVKHLVPGVKVGHAGSLDPFASGVLVVLVGKATKLSGSLLNADKTYVATIRLGSATDSMDRTGEVSETAAVPELTRAKVLEVLQGFEGEWLQTPPMYSAKKIHGVRLYTLARENIRVKRPPIPVMLYELRLQKREADCLEVFVHCSKGTYIRSFADEFARRLGTVGHLEELRRLSCGPFLLERAVTLEALQQDPAPAFGDAQRNYVQLLRNERLHRQAAPATGHLPTGLSNGNSLLR